MTVIPPSRPCAITRPSASTASRPVPCAFPYAQTQPVKPSSTRSTATRDRAPSRCCNRAATNALARRSGANTPQSRSHNRRRSVPMHNAKVQRPTAVAMRRCVCSTATPPTIFGIGEPKQVGQSGHARPESVLVTRPPATIRRSVRNAAAAARRRTHIGRRLQKRREERVFYAPLPCNGKPENGSAAVSRPVLAGALLSPVVLECHLGGLAGFDGHFLRLRAVLLVPRLERVLARGHIVDLERTVGAAHRLQAVLGDADVAAHPGMHVALPPHHSLFLRGVLDGRRLFVRHALVEHL